MISYLLYNLIAITLADVIRILNLVSKMKVLTKRFQNVSFVNFIKLSESYDYLCFFHCEHLPNMGRSRKNVEKFSKIFHN